VGSGGLSLNVRTVPQVRQGDSTKVALRSSAQPKPFLGAKHFRTRQSHRQPPHDQISRLVSGCRRAIAVPDETPLT